MRLIIALILISFQTHAKTIKEGDREYSCSPKATCEERLKQAEEKLKQAKKQRVIELVEVDRPVYKKHLFSVFAHRAIVSKTSTSNGVNGTVGIRTELVPGFMYQYKFDNGFVPMLSFDGVGELAGGVGIEF